MTREQQVAALRRWPKVLARSFIGKYAPDVRPTWDEWCEALDQFEDVLNAISQPPRRRQRR
jgi:hypothetical protein